MKFATNLSIIIKPIRPNPLRCMNTMNTKLTFGSAKAHWAQNYDAVDRGMMPGQGIKSPPPFNPAKFIPGRPRACRNTRENTGFDDGNSGGGEIFLRGCNKQSIGLMREKEEEVPPS